jgi:3-dehydroquinate synthase
MTDQAAPITVMTSGASGPYPVLVGRGLLSELAPLLEEYAPAHRYALVSDSNVAALYGESTVLHLRDAGLGAELFTFEAGERNKNRARWSQLTDGLLRAGFGRDSCLIAMGGGVTGDLSGFVAATYMRGIPVVQVPTSLVAMIDASIGGKTGVDVEAGKNLVGAFHPPNLVVADPDVVATLPGAERAQGMIEAVKHGAIMDDAYFAELDREMPAILDGEATALERVVARSVELKSAVVSEDEREAGRREILNFGHTLGHAIEAACSFRVPHGTAVASGMILEARLGVSLGVTGPDVVQRLEQVIDRVGLPSSIPDSAAPDDIMTYLASDKKVRHGRTRFVLLSEIGAVHPADGSWSHPVDDQIVSDLVNAYAPKT